MQRHRGRRRPRHVAPAARRIGLLALAAVAASIAAAGPVPGAGTAAPAGSVPDAEFAAAASGAAAAQDPHAGKAVYDRWCAQCHGDEGRGDGVAAAYMLPRPRDFTSALYQVRSTPSGALPRDADILRVIDEGMPGTAMPGWKDRLSAADREALVGYLKGFSHFFTQEAAPEALAAGRPPRVTEEGLAEGREFYDRIECWKCHGQAGRGDGASAPTQEDDNGFPIRPADLTRNWRFNGGGRVEDIYLRLRSGLDGTPMPSFSDLLESGFMTDEQLWHLAQYVRSLSPERAPRIREVIRAARVEGELPTTPDDSAWAAVESFHIPLIGQIAVKPRWFAPTVENLEVQALHDDREVVLRIVWSDPSRSPDPAWSEWQARVAAAMEPREGDTVVAGAALPDAIAVQFPRSIPTGMERPFVLMGSARDPVYLWRWRSDSPAPEEALARGLDRIEPLPSGGGLEGSAVWEYGQWRLVLRRPLEPADSADRLAFATGQAIPIAFYAWDGSNGEAGTRGSIGSWFYVYLDRPTPPTVYTTPGLAVLFTAGLGLVIVGRAQRRERQQRNEESNS